MSLRDSNAELCLQKKLTRASIGKNNVWVLRLAWRLNITDEPNAKVLTACDPLSGFFVRERRKEKEREELWRKLDRLRVNTQQSSPTSTSSRHSGRRHRMK